MLRGIHDDVFLCFCVGLFLLQLSQKSIYERLLLLLNLWLAVCDRAYSSDSFNLLFRKNDW